MRMIMRMRMRMRMRGDRVRGDRVNEWKPKTNNKTVRWKQRSKKYVGSKLTMYLETFKPIKYSLKDSIKFILWSTKIGYQPKW